MTQLSRLHRQHGLAQETRPHSQHMIQQRLSSCLQITIELRRVEQIHEGVQEVPLDEVVHVGFGETRKRPPLSPLPSDSLHSTPRSNVPSCVIIDLKPRIVSAPSAAANPDAKMGRVRLPTHVVAPPAALHPVSLTAPHQLPQTCCTTNIDLP